MRVKEGNVEIRVTLSPELYSLIEEYLGTDDSKKIDLFIDEVLSSYLEMHSQFYEEELGEHEN